MYRYLPVLEFISSFLEVYLCYRILNLLFVSEYRNTRREAVFQECIIAGYSFLLAAFIRYNDQVLLFSDLLVFEVVLAVFLTGAWFFDVGKLAVLSVIGFYFMCLSLLDVLGIVMLSRTLENAQFAVQLSGGSWFRTLFILSVDSAWLVIYLALRRVMRGKCKNGVAKYKVWILAATAVGYGAVYYFQTVAFVNLTEALASTWIIFLLLFFMFFAAAGIYKKYRDTQEETRLVEIQKYYLEDNMRDMQQIYDSSSRNYHDIKNHLNAIYQMVKDGHSAEALEYIERVAEPFQQLDRRHFTGCQMVDMILNCCVEACDKKQIALDVDADPVPTLPFQNQDICTIFSNLLDNAVEACQELPPDMRWIQVRVSQKNSMLFIRVKNTMGQKPEVQKGRLRTRKSNHTIHGLGIENIRRAVEKYDGFYDYSYSGEMFETTVTLPL